MKKIYRNFVTEDEARELLSEPKGSLDGKIKKRDHWLLDRILNTLSEDFEFTVVYESYSSLESNANGHKWHVDTGTSNHMMWCDIGVSLLLKESNGGGDTYYADNSEGLNKEKSDRRIYDLVAHTSDEWHMVDPNNGVRTVFLMFI